VASPAEGLVVRYVMKQKWLAFGDDFKIQDASGVERYFVDGRALSIGDKLSFQDMAGNELAFIRQRLLAWGPTYEILRGDRVLATVKKRLFTLFKCRFEVDVPGPRDIEAHGDFLDHEYVFERDGDAVATVSKRWFSWTDTYGIDVENGEDDVLILASAVVIDLVCHDRKD
jgi:uncharacterized protein YxjI